MNVSSKKNLSRNLDVGYWMLGNGCWVLDTGFKMLDTGCWILDIGKLQVEGSWWIAVDDS